jgi:hypothetical protein
MVTVTGSTTGDLAGLWPLFGLLIETPRLQLRLPREDELPALTDAARDIAGPADPRLQMPWMYGGSPDLERRLQQRHWRALAHWKPANWHLPLAVFLAAEPIGMQDLWAEEFAQRRSAGHRLVDHPGQARPRVRHRGTRRGPGPGLRPPGRGRGADRVHRGQPRIRTGLPQARLYPQRPAHRPPRRHRPRHRIPAPPRPPRLGKPRPARPHRRHRPRTMHAHARPARLRGPGMRRATATAALPAVHRTR